MMRAKQEPEADATLGEEGKKNSLAQGREDVPENI